MRFYAFTLLFSLVAAFHTVIPTEAEAASALFRVEQSWHSMPNLAITPGGAGMYQAYIQPYVKRDASGNYLYPPAEAIVEPGNPIGGKFTLPLSFIDHTGAITRNRKTGWGYTSYTYPSYYNGSGVFEPNHGPTTPTWIVFSTTQGNLYPNYATGNPVTPTTTFGGLYDFARVGSINVMPGPRRFGGTFRLFYRPTASLYQYVYYFSPYIYKGYGHFSCIDEGVTCNASNFKSTAGDITALYRFTRFLLNVKGTGTGPGFQSNTAKATTSLGAGGYPTPSSNVSFVTGMQQYLNTIHPWTTGFASVHNPIGSPHVITPQAKGYDMSLGGADITVTRVNHLQQWNKTLITLTTATTTYKQPMKSVRRVVSMVRPRLVHTYSVSRFGPTTMSWSAARLWAMKVYFLPEPAGMLMLGAGVAALLGLSRMRRR